MKTINENLIKKSLLYMNYDSKKTLSENLDRIMLNESWVKVGTTTKDYILKMRYDNALGTARKQWSIPKDSLINKEGDILNFGNTSMGYSCASKVFAIISTNSSSFGAEYENDELKNLLDKDFCTTKSSFDWMANNNDSYWSALKTNLEKNSPLIPYVKEGTIEGQGPIYYWGKFVIRRNYSGTFASHTDPSATAKIDPTNYNGKYAGQPALSDIKLIVDGTNEKMSLLDFISKYTPKKDEKVVDKTKSDVKTTPKKITTPSTGWNETCQGTYSMGCKTPEVGRVQQCLKDQGLYPYTVDDKFGRKTRTAIYNKLGKSSFTDADIVTICKTTVGGGGEPQDDFDSDMGRRTGQEQEIDDKTWTGDVY